MDYDWIKARADLLTPRPGWLGRFTEQDAPGAIRKGARIFKAQDELGDGTPLGTGGTVLGSMHDPEKGTCYFIEWDDKPKCAVAVIAWKIGRQQ